MLNSKKPLVPNRPMSRRELLRHLVNKARDSVPSLPSPIRPPGAIEETLFNALCTGCGECATACPEQAITLYEQRPEMDFPHHYCNRCHNCAAACPKGLLQATGTIQAHPQLQGECQNRYLYCDSCAEFCARQAIRWQAGQAPVIENALCDGCGECAFRCPVNALKMVWVTG
ncbi:MAG: 4Fe-4S binding protein [Enterobacteriaceae bacterium]